MRTTYAVWEITLKCNLACSHCGSRAAEARPNELTTAEALELVRQLAEVGIHEVTLIGGEAFLRADWLTIVAAIRDAGMKCSLTTGGYGVSAAAARAMRKAGLGRVSVSVDGLEPTHDRLRGRSGSWRACFDTMKHVLDAGIPIGNNTQINRLSAPELPALYETLRDAGSDAWQIQLTVPMGNAADHAEILLQPSELLDLYPMLARIALRAQRERVLLYAGNNIGYYGPYERLLRGGGEWSFWTGCGAGLNTLGIEADGSIKACPSLPTAAYVGGNIRETPLREILGTPELSFNVGAGKPGGDAALWGFCKSCEYASVCRAGCSWTAHVFFGRRGNNPYCHHRALQHASRGVRERLRLVRRATGVPFDHGEFEIAEEESQTPWPDLDPLHFTADRIHWPPSWDGASAA